MSQAPAQPSRDRILDAAENAFAQGGFEGASLREIVCQAQVNLATVYYYFQSKSGLIEAVLKRRFGPLRAEHLERLRRLEQEAGGRAVALEKILEAMLVPPLRLLVAAPARRHAVTRLVGRIATDPDPGIQSMVRNQRSEVRAAFLAALQASLPCIPRAELEVRTECVWGALAFILCNPPSVEEPVRGNGRAGSVDALMQQMIKFFASGFRAAQTAKRDRLRRRLMTDRKPI